MNVTRYRQYAWGALAYNLLVGLWGAVVRATGSGAGCGRHWPLCNGEVVPRPERIETLVEFTHRLSSGLALLAVVGLVWWAWQLYPAGSPVRQAARWSGIFIITESLLGAMLVLFAWVAFDQSIERAISMSFHLINTLLLLASLALTAWYASGHQPPQNWRVSPRRWPLTLTALGLMTVGASGAITALGDTLFPQADFLDNFSASAHFLIRLRIWHPILAVLVGYFVIQQAARWKTISGALRRALIGLILVQWAAGLLNVWLRVPLWLQLTHLLLADSIWLLFVLSANQALDTEVA